MLGVFRQFVARSSGISNSDMFSARFPSGIGEHGIKYQSIIRKVTDFFESNDGLRNLELINESYMHSVPPNSETHFKIIVVSDHFNGKRLVQRHQLINKLLADELKTGVHALSIHTFNTQEWLKQQEENDETPNSPTCLGGSKSAGLAPNGEFKKCDKPTQ